MPGRTQAARTEPSVADRSAARFCPQQPISDISSAPSSPSRYRRVTSCRLARWHAPGSV